MKKRGVLPNAQTFTVIFRGLARSDHPKNAVLDAVKLLNQMKDDRRNQPNALHLNAVLTVCSRAYDVEHLLQVAANFEDRHLEPDAATYGILLSGLRHYTYREYKDLDRDTRADNTRVMVGRAQNIWQEVLQKWRAGKVALDETLVCTMGRMLLLSPDREVKLQVLDLVEQTMNLPNLVAAKKSNKTPAKTLEAESTEAKDTETKDTEAKDTETKDGKPSASKDLATTKPRSGAGRFVRPGKNTLALILTTVQVARQSGAAAPYWNLFVNDLRVVPDNDNWLRMIGVLKTSKSSAQAAQFVETLPTSGVDVQPRSFAIAMEACVRDNVNPGVMANATSILRTMQRHLPAGAPDMHVMRLYLRAALVSHASFRDRAAAGDEAGAKAAYGTQIATALAELWEPYVALYNAHFKDERANYLASKNEKKAALLYTQQKEVIALGRMMVGGFSKVVEEKMLPGNNNRDMVIASAKINKGVQAFFADRERREPKLNKAATAARRRDLADKGLDEAADAAPELDMPELDESTTDAKHPDTVRRGADFVWNTNKPLRRKKETILKHTKQALKRDLAADNAALAKPVIDRFVSAPVKPKASAEKTAETDSGFVHINPPVSEPDSETTKPSSARSRPNSTASGPEGSIWADLMAKRKASLE